VSVYGRSFGRSGVTKIKQLLRELLQMCEKGLVEVDGETKEIDENIMKIPKHPTGPALDAH
jgi:hypothetical protein